MKIVTVLGTRPEIIKLSPLIPLLGEEFKHIIIHTGQHYDHNMDKVFFNELHLPLPNYALNIGSHSQGKQTGLMLQQIETIFLEEKPGLVIVQGDTNTTLAGALAASKLHLPLIHLEAGCRSFNRQMPEEINRIVVDHIADYLIAPDQKSVNNLLHEGINKNNIFLLGSTAFDATLRNKDLIDTNEVLNHFSLRKKEFILVTLHRAENTNDLNKLNNIISALNELSEFITFVFPLHPRTKKIVDDNNIIVNNKIKMIAPQSYLSFLALLSSCKFCISDSGGIQEEAIVFNVPCLIPREETEWTRLVDAGKNILMGTNTERIVTTVRNLLSETKLQKIKERKCHYEAGVSEKIIKLIKQIKK
ncbi:MAG: UDP-N-acetylglucosamine 2-epimerase (non-hydrolyzing) [Nanoarchaeota archaeon]|nr:UDP-N-acetylglucosamine 2-epimerase (non-hydrolyzing) [Nanoarchaeota archaeon]